METMWDQIIEIREQSGIANLWISFHALLRDVYLVKTKKSTFKEFGLGIWKSRTLWSENFQIPRKLGTARKGEDEGVNMEVNRY